MKSIIDEMNKRIDELTAAKAAQVDEIETRIRETREAKAAALKRIEEAQAALDADAYQDAQIEITRLDVQEDMYAGRHEDILRKKTVTEAESDAAIEGLLDYARELVPGYLDAIRGPLLQLKTITDDYLSEVDRTRRTVDRWTREIHAYYHHVGMSRIDPETGKPTDKDGHPAIVSVDPCGVSKALQTFLEKNSELWSED